MSHWLNHDFLAIDRHARRHRDRQTIFNLAGAGVLGAANYLLGRAAYSSLFPQNNMPAIRRQRIRTVSGYAPISSSDRPAKRRRLTGQRQVASSKRTVIKTTRKSRKRTKRVARRPRRNVKKSRKSRFKNWGSFQKLGILRTVETGVSTTGVTDAGFLGHASFRPTAMLTDFMLVLLKAAFARAGIHMNNCLDVVPVGAGGAVELYVKKNLGPATALTSASYIFLGGETWTSTAVALWGDVMTKVSAAEIPSTTILGINVSSVSSGPSCRLNLIGAKIHVRSESWLKIQNQTYSLLGGEETEVDRIPILMNKYWGYGTGACTNRGLSTEDQIVANQANGLITKVGSVAAGTSEAPPRTYFTGCKSKKQFVLSPGHFASSKAYFNTSVAVDKFWIMIASQYTSASTYNYYPYGSWNLFHFEHLIKPKSTTSSLIVNGEVNFKTGMYVSLQRYHNTDERIESTTYVTY